MIVKQPYYLGLPMWSNRDWSGSLYPPAANSKNFLRHYCSVFNTVEGNTTFYALPSENTVRSWCEQLRDASSNSLSTAPADFQFSFKLPKDVTHGGRLNTGDTLTQFFHRLAPLEQAQGPFMIQLPASFGEPQLNDLAAFIQTLPAGLSFAVEVRHRVFFQKGDAEKRLNALLINNNIDRVCFDSRPLFSRPAVSAVDRDAQTKKPRLPVHAIATAQQPMVRFIGTADAHYNEQYFKPWRAKIAQWVSEGRKPFVFVHTPSNQHAPQHALAIHQQLSALPDWQALSMAAPAEQLGIF